MAPQLEERAPKEGKLGSQSDFHGWHSASQHDPKSPKRV